MDEESLPPPLLNRSGGNVDFPARGSGPPLYKVLTGHMTIVKFWNSRVTKRASRLVPVLWCDGPARDVPCAQTAEHRGGMIWMKGLKKLPPLPSPRTSGAPPPPPPSLPTFFTSSEKDQSKEDAFLEVVSKGCTAWVHSFQKARGEKRAKEMCIPRRWVVPCKKRAATGHGGGNDDGICLPRYAVFPPLCPLARWGDIERWSRGGITDDVARRLRPHQLTVVDSMQAQWGASGTSLVVMPTGSGKTFTTIAALKGVLERGGRVLVVVKATPLIKQWRDAVHGFLSCTRGGGGQKDGVPVRVSEWRGKPAPDSSCNVVIGSATTMHMRLSHPDTFSEYNHTVAGFDVLVWDEVHTASCSTARKLLATIPAPVRVALTATPCDSSGCFAWVVSAFGPIRIMVADNRGDTKHARRKTLPHAPSESSHREVGGGVRPCSAHPIHVFQLPVDLAGGDGDDAAGVSSSVVVRDTRPPHSVNYVLTLKNIAQSRTRNEEIIRCAKALATGQKGCYINRICPPSSQAGRRRTLIMGFFRGQAILWAHALGVDVGEHLSKEAAFFFSPWRWGSTAADSSVKVSLILPGHTDTITSAQSSDITVSTFSSLGTGVHLDNYSAIILGAPRFDGPLWQAVGRIGRMNCTETTFVIVDVADIVPAYNAPERQASTRRAFYQKQGWTLVPSPPPRPHCSTAVRTMNAAAAKPPGSGVQKEETT